MWRQNVKTWILLQTKKIKELEKITCKYISNKLTINFEKTNAILSSNSLNAQNDCPDVFFKLGQDKLHEKLNA